MITDAELAAMRADMVVTMAETVVIQRASRASDGAGGGSLAWLAVGTVPGHTTPELTGTERQIADRLSSVMPWMVNVPALTDVQPRDQLIVDGQQTFRVLVVFAPRTWEIHRRTLCEEIR